MFMLPPIALHTTVPDTVWSWPSTLTLAPPLGAAVALAVPASVVASADVAGLSDFLLSDEQPDRPATTIAAPPTATKNSRLTTVLLCVVVTRLVRRIISSSMVRAPPADMRLREIFAEALMKGTRANPQGVCSRNMQTLRTPDERFANIPEFPYAPKYCEIDDGDGGLLRVAWLQRAPPTATQC